MTSKISGQSAIICRLNRPVKATATCLAAAPIDGYQTVCIPSPQRHFANVSTCRGPSQPSMVDGAGRWRDSQNVKPRNVLPCLCTELARLDPASVADPRDHVVISRLVPLGRLCCQHLCRIPAKSRCNGFFESHAPGFCTPALRIGHLAVPVAAPQRRHLCSVCSPP